MKIGIFKTAAAMLLFLAAAAPAAETEKSFTLRAASANIFETTGTQYGIGYGITSFARNGFVWGIDFDLDYLDLDGANDVMRMYGDTALCFVWGTLCCKTTCSSTSSAERWYSRCPAAAAMVSASAGARTIGCSPICASGRSTARSPSPVKSVTTITPRHRVS